MVSTDRRQISGGQRPGGQERELIAEVAQKTFWDVGNVLCLGCDGGEMAGYNIQLNLLNTLVFKYTSIKLTFKVI